MRDGTGSLGIGSDGDTRRASDVACIWRQTLFVSILTVCIFSIHVAFFLPGRPACGACYADAAFSADILAAICSAFHTNSPALFSY